ncbi:MAG: AAA family ATPase [Opitutaceae bacterium]|jgi:hypothetical protein
MTTSPENESAVNLDDGSSHLTAKGTLAHLEAQMVKNEAPEAVKEGSVWLHQFMHRCCSGSPALVASILKKISAQDYPNKEQYIYQIARGIYFKKAAGRQAIETFKEMIDRLIQWDRIEQTRGRVPFNENLRSWVLLRDYIDSRRALGAVCKFGAICAETGMGKTEGTKHYQLLNTHALTVRTEMPMPCTLARFVTYLGCCYNIPTSLSTSERLMAIDENVTEARTIIVENCQKAFNPKSGHIYLPIFYYLQELQDNRGCTVILTWTPQFEGEIIGGKHNKYFEQFISRIGGADEVLQLPRPNKADLRAIIEQFEIADSAAALPLLAEWSRQPGPYRLIFHRLQRAKMLAGKSGLRASHLERVASTPVNQALSEEDES